MNLHLQIGHYILKYGILVLDLPLYLILLLVEGLKLLSLICLLVLEVFLQLANQLRILICMTLQLSQDWLHAGHLGFQVLLVPNQRVDVPVQGDEGPLDGLDIHDSFR